jgi:hypothetical protein
MHPRGEPCRSGKLGVVTFKPHGCAGIDPDRLFCHLVLKEGNWLSLVCVVHFGGAGLFTLRSGWHENV